MKNREKFVPLAAALFVCAGLQVRQLILNLYYTISGEPIINIPFVPKIDIPLSLHIKSMIMIISELCVLVLFAIFFLNLKNKVLYRAALIVGVAVFTFLFISYFCALGAYLVLSLLLIFVFINSMVNNRLLSATRIVCIAALAMNTFFGLSGIIISIVNGYHIDMSTILNLFINPTALPITVLPFSLMMYHFSIGRPIKKTAADVA